jgi:hypothetical protein
MLALRMLGLGVQELGGSNPYYLARLVWLGVSTGIGGLSCLARLVCQDYWSNKELGMQEMIIVGLLVQAEQYLASVQIMVLSVVKAIDSPARG